MAEEIGLRKLWLLILGVLTLLLHVTSPLEKLKWHGKGLKHLANSQAGPMACQHPGE